MITQSELLKVISYNSETGLFTWLKRSDVSEHINDQKSGKTAGHNRTDGYVTITIKGVNYQAHRLAWIYVYNEQPDVIDHINGIRNDNRIINLANESPAGNSRNLSLGFQNKFGCFGISEITVIVKEKRFRSVITIDGKYINLGTFSDVNDAIKARREAEKRYFFKDGHGKRHVREPEQKEVQKRRAKRK